MAIIFKAKEDLQISIRAFSPGDTFIFEGEEIPYILAENENEERFVVNLEDGSSFPIVDEWTVIEVDILAEAKRTPKKRL